MRRLTQLLMFLALVTPGGAQTLTRQNLAEFLGFENNSRAGGCPAGWSCSPAGTIFVDDQVVHSGKYAARIERTGSSSGTFSTLTNSIPLDFVGNTIEWRGVIKAENAGDSVALWVREDGAKPSLAFATMQGQHIRGTFDWTEYSITLPVSPDARILVFGILLSGTGKAWVDDLQMLVDGKPIAQAPSIFDFDHEFDSGSKISIGELTQTQVANLARLAKVWGFLKYHHPAVTGGKNHWDYELFRVLPQVIAAEDNTSANAAISGWIAGLEPVADCGNTCATLDPNNLYMKPDLNWIQDESRLGAELSQKLQEIYRDRVASNVQFFVYPAPTQNPVFANEPNYRNILLPDAGYQLLALFRYWNMVQYFYPDRDVMADAPAALPHYWDNVLTESIPAFALARDSVAYQRELLKLAAKINDSHAQSASLIAALPPVGDCVAPADVRFIEGSPVVFRDPYPDSPSGLLPGDVIRAMNGVAVEDLVAQWIPYYPGSNHAARMRNIGRWLVRGSCDATSWLIQRGGDALNLVPNRIPIAGLPAAPFIHDRPGDTFQLLTSDVAYLKLSSVQASKAANYIQSAAGTQGLIIDIRNYPAEFVVFALGDLLVSAVTPIARYTYSDMINPGAFAGRPRHSR